MKEVGGRQIKSSLFHISLVTLQTLLRGTIAILNLCLPSRDVAILEEEEKRRYQVTSVSVLSPGNEAYLQSRLECCDSFFSAPLSMLWIAWGHALVSSIKL